MTPVAPPRGHLPSFLLSGLPLQDMPPVAFMEACLGLNLLVTWTFNHTGGSLIPVFLYHVAFNFIGNATGIFNDLHCSRCLRSFALRE